MATSGIHGVCWLRTDVMSFVVQLLQSRSGTSVNEQCFWSVSIKRWRLSILVTETWARSWSRCTGNQPAGHPPGGRLPLLSARPAVTFPAAEHHRLLAGTKLYCLVTEAHTGRCEQLAQGSYAAFPRVGFEPTICWSQVQCSTYCATTVKI